MLDQESEEKNLERFEDRKEEKDCEWSWHWKFRTETSWILLKTIWYELQNNKVSYANRARTPNLPASQSNTSSLNEFFKALLKQHLNHYTFSLNLYLIHLTQAYGCSPIYVSSNSTASLCSIL